MSLARGGWGHWYGDKGSGYDLGARALDYSQAKAMTLTFTCLILSEFIQAYCFRSQHRPFYRRAFTNGWLNLAVGSQVLLLMVLLYVPMFQAALGTVALGPRDWLLVAAAAGSILPVIEITKWAVAPTARAS